MCIRDSKPALARGELQLVGATTLNEYRIIEKDAALERRMQPVKVDEPTVEDVYKRQLLNQSSVFQGQFPWKSHTTCPPMS